jgi:hypothetical protein
MPGPAPRPRYPRATGPLRAQHFPRKLLRRGGAPGPEPVTFRILAESGARLRTESNAPIRTEQE